MLLRSLQGHRGDEEESRNGKGGEEREGGAGDNSCEVYTLREEVQHTGTCARQLVLVQE